MKAKKIIKIVVLTFICLFILSVVFLFGWFDSEFYSSLVGRKYYSAYEEKYYKMESYRSPNHSNLSFSRYYYLQFYIKEAFPGSSKCISVEDNVETIKKYISTSLDELYESDNNIDIEFNYDAITSNDYYYLRIEGEEVFLRYYDIDENILYKIYFYK